MINWELLYNKLLETKSTDKGEKHHIVPKHDGGKDEDGIVILERRHHILAHYIRFKWKSQIGDRVAYQMMSGQLAHPLFDKTHSNETKNKMSISAKKISHLDRSGKNHYRYGKTVSFEIAKKIGDSQRGELNHRFGKSNGDYQKNAARIANSGKNSPNSKRVIDLKNNLIFDCYADACSYYKVSKPTITNWVRKGLLQTVKL